MSFVKKGIESSKNFWIVLEKVSSEEEELRKIMTKCNGDAKLMKPLHVDSIAFEHFELIIMFFFVHIFLYK